MGWVNFVDIYCDIRIYVIYICRYGSWIMMVFGLYLGKEFLFDFLEKGEESCFVGGYFSF